MSRVRFPVEAFVADLWLKYEALAWFLAGAMLVAGLWELDRNPSVMAAQSRAITNNPAAGVVEVIWGRLPLRIRLQRRAGISAPPPDTTQPKAEREWPAPRTPEIRNLTVDQEHATEDPLPYRISLQDGRSIQFRRSALP